MKKWLLIRLRFTDDGYCRSNLGVLSNIKVRFRIQLTRDITEMWITENLNIPEISRVTTTCKTPVYRDYRDYLDKPELYRLTEISVISSVDCTFFSWKALTTFYLYKSKQGRCPQKLHHFTALRKKVHLLFWGSLGSTRDHFFNAKLWISSLRFYTDSKSQMIRATSATMNDA